MEIVELVDPRYFPLNSHHLKGCKDYFFILASTREFLIWPGGEIKVRHAFSEKRMGRIKTKPVNLAKDMCRCIVGRFGSETNNWMSITEDTEDYWTLIYSPSINVRIMDEIIGFLSRLKI